MLNHSFIAVLIFLFVYGIIIAGENSPRKLDRPAAALIGAVLMVITGVLSRRDALASIDFPTLALLFGMMMIVHYAGTSGLLDWIAEHLMHFAHTPAQLIWVVCFASGILSALFVNDTICLLMTPLLLAVTRRTGLPPEPYLICLATSSNVGSAMTVTGNPQNMLIGQSSGWGWTPFFMRMVPIVLLCLVINALVVLYIYKKPLGANAAAVESEHTSKPLDKKLATKTIVVIVALLIAFLVGAPMDLSALTAGIAILVMANEPPEHTFATIDWALLLFFAGLFVVVQGITVTQSHAIMQIMPFLTERTQGFGGMCAFSGATLIASNVFGNVPLVMLVRGWMHAAPNASLLWLVLALVSTFAGNLTLVGSVANLIVANGAKGECDLTFMSFLKVGVPTTLITTAVGVSLLWLMHLWQLV